MTGDEALLTSAAAAVTAAMIVIWILYLKFFVVVPPNRALVMFGRGTSSQEVATPGARGTVRTGRVRIEVGGGVFVPPWTSDYALLPLNALDIDMQVKDVVTAEIAIRRLDVRIAAEVKIPADLEQLQAAAESLLGKTEEEMKAIARSIIEGYVRGEFAKRSLLEIDHERERVAAEIQVLSATDLVSLGLVVKSLVIKGIEPAGGLPDEEKRHAVEVRSAQLEGLIWQLSAQVRKLEMRVEGLQHGAVLVGRELQDLNSLR